MRQAAAWAISDGLLQLPEVDPIDILAEQMAQAVREEYRTDSEGRRYRVNHAVRATKSAYSTRFGVSWDMHLTTTWKKHLLSAVS